MTWSELHNRIDRLVAECGSEAPAFGANATAADYCRWLLQCDSLRGDDRQFCEDVAAGRVTVE